MQNLRSLLQKRLTGRLSVNGASYSRFLFALPFAMAYLLMLSGSRDVPAPNGAFLAFVTLAAVSQIVGTSALLASFTERNFAVGTAYSKTEVVQTAVVGFVVLAEPVSGLAMAAIAVSLVGVWVLSIPPGSFRLGGGSGSRRAVWLGMLSGAGFAVAAVCFRGASLSLPHGDFLVRAAVTLAVGLVLQTLIMGGYLLLREPGQVRAVAGSWRVSLWVGLAGMLASAGWFTAMTLETAALVRALAQVELIFTFLTAVIVFKEAIRAREVLGVALIIGGIYLLLLGNGSL